MYPPKKTTEDDDPGAPPPKEMTTQTPLRREQLLTRQDSELTFATEAPWEENGQSSEPLIEQNKINFIRKNVMLSVEEEGGEEDEESPIKFDGHGR